MVSVPVKRQRKQIDCRCMIVGFPTLSFCPKRLKKSNYFRSAKITCRQKFRLISQRISPFSIPLTPLTGAVSNLNFHRLLPKKNSAGSVMEPTHPASVRHHHLPTVVPYSLSCFFQKEFFMHPPDTCPQILGIGGSPRAGGNSDHLLKQILKGCEQNGASTRPALLRNYQFQGCIGCERCRKDKICTGLNDGMTLLYPEIATSKALVLVCPTHNYNITAWMKAFIDRLYCFYNFENTRPRKWSSQLAGQGRKAVIAAICEQESAKDMGFTLDAMRLPLEALGYDIIGELPVLNIFDKAGVRNHPEIMEQAEHAGNRLADAIRS